jgi:hypothetical protein
MTERKLQDALLDRLQQFLIERSPPAYSNVL